MRLSFSHKLLLTSVVLLLAPTVSAQGYFNGTKGARSAGRAGAVVVKADDVSAMEYNPAGLARMRGTTIQLSNRFSYNYSAFSRDVTVDPDNQNTLTAFKQVENQLPLQAVDPMLGVTTDFGLADWGFGLAVYAPPGVGRLEFPVGPGPYDTPETGLDGGQRYMMVKRDAAILTYAASVAWKFKEIFGLGATLQWIHVPHLQYSLVVDGSLYNRDANPVSSQFDILSTIEGSDPFTLNAVVGGWVRALPFLEFGLSAQIVPTQIDARSELQMDTLELNPEQYPLEIERNGQVVNANDPTQPANRVGGIGLTLPLPMTFRGGVRYVHEKEGKSVFDLEFNAIYQTWSAVDEFYVDTNLTDTAEDALTVNIVNAGDAPLDDVIIAKRWQDTLTLRLGGDFNILPFLTARAGIAYETAVSPDEYLNVDFAGGQHVTGALGASLLFRPVEIGLSYGLRHMIPASVTEYDGRVYQEVPSSMCDPTDPMGINSCHDSLLPPNAPAPGKPRPTVNGGRYTAFTHAISVDVIYRF